MLSNDPWFGTSVQPTPCYPTETAWVNWKLKCSIYCVEVPHTVAVLEALIGPEESSNAEKIYGELKKTEQSNYIAANPLVVDGGAIDLQPQVEAVVAAALALRAEVIPRQTGLALSTIANEIASMMIMITMMR